MSKITFITPTQGNPIALLRTMESVKDICDEFIVGSVCVFEEDIQTILGYTERFNLRVLPIGFNHIFKNGFSRTLNLIAAYATNSICLYLNVGEVIEKGEDILGKISDEYNAYYIDHKIEKHRWWRCFNPKELYWQGIIHEEIRGEYRPYHKPLFTFADTEKDMDDPFKATVYNDIKEIVYWHQLIKLADDPSLAQGTDPSWILFAKEQYDTMKHRLALKRGRYQAFIDGDLNAYLSDVNTDPELEKQRFESSLAIEFQGDKKYLL